MTDNEIKKGLECCIIGDCQGCIYGVTDQRHCKDNLMQNALDLINRQQAEIERLQKETERFADIGKMYSEIKAEAIKEFAERLHSASFITGYTMVFGGKEIPLKHITAASVDSILKEMTEAQNGSISRK